MSGIKSLLRTLAMVLVCTVFFASPALAATLLFNDSGEITGAQGVIVTVDGVSTTYDVTFVEGTGYDVYTYENSTWTFNFNSEESAEAAAQALLDQVFTGDYNDPTSIFGIDDTATSAKIYIACDTASWSTTWLALVYARNYADDDSDEIATKYLSASTSTADESDAVYAVFTLANSSAVPVPGTFMLLGLGMLGLAGTNRRRHNK